MTDEQLLRQLRDLDRRVGQTETKEVPALYLPWTQRILNAFPLVSSNAAWGDMAQPWPVNVLAWYCSVYVANTNSGTNFWTVTLRDTAATTLASFTTAAIAANTWTRFVVTGGGITQPGSSNVALTIIPTATLSPGAIYIVPAVALLRTGN